jgi:hypothetical protein
MGKIDKTLALALILIIAMLCLTLLIVNPTNAQSIPKPSVPEFTVRYADDSYYMQPTYGTDPYSGKTVKIGGDFMVYNKTIEVTVISQSFTPYTFNDGTPHSVYLRWDIAFKGHYGDDWSISSQSPNWNESSKVIAFGLGMESSDHYISQGHMDIPTANQGDQIDFKVRARIGYDIFIPDPLRSGFYNEGTLEFHGETSEWSNIQTITIGGVNNSNTPNPTSTPTSPTTSPITSTPTSTPIAPDTNSNSTNSTLSLNTFVAIIAVTVIASIAVALLALSFRRHRAKINSPSASP